MVESTHRQVTRTELDAICIHALVDEFTKKRDAFSDAILTSPLVSV